MSDFVYKIVVPATSRKRFKVCANLDAAVAICRATNLRPLAVVRTSKNPSDETIPIPVAVFK
jgi:hypothetical protein